MRAKGVALILAITGGAFAAPAAEPSGAAARALAPLAACAAIAAAERAGCYDRAFAQLRAAVAAGEIVISDAVQRRALFGFGAAEVPAKPAKAAKGETARPPAPASVEGQVAAVREVGYGQLTVTLADGAVWQTTEADASFFVRPGDTAKLSRGALGSYFLEVRGHATRARRVR